MVAASEDGCDGALLKEHFPAEAAKLERICLLDQELDQRTVTRKRRLANAITYGDTTMRHTLRLFVSHSLCDGPSDDDRAEEESADGQSERAWRRVRLEGGIIEGNTTSRHVKLTQFFDRITMTFNWLGTKTPSSVFEWVRPADGRIVESDLLDVRVPADRNANLRLTLHHRSQGAQWQRYRLSADLSRLLRLPRDNQRLETIEAALVDFAYDRDLISITDTLPLTAALAADNVAIASVVVGAGGGGNVSGHAGGVGEGTVVVACDYDLCRVLGLKQQDNVLPLHEVGQRLLAQLSLAEPTVIDVAVNGDDDRRLFDMKVQAPARFPCIPQQQPRPDADAEAGGAKGVEKRVSYLMRQLQQRLSRIQVLRAIARDPINGVQVAAKRQRAAAKADAVDVDDVFSMSALLREEQGAKKAARSQHRSNGDAHKGGQGGLDWLVAAAQDYLLQDSV